MPGCAHPDLHLLNPFELMRKYACKDCFRVMMCACDEEIGRRHLPHQLDTATELRTQSRIIVDGGFVPGLCARCRGLPEEAAPLAQGYGRTSKVKRYYWREIQFETWRRLDAAGEVGEEERDRIQREVLDYFKQVYATAPLYAFHERSQEQVLREHRVEQLELEADYADAVEKGAVILDGAHPISPEEFAARRFRSEGWEVVFAESRPWHALFAVLMHPLIEDSNDNCRRVSMFGERQAFEEKRPGEQITMLLPEDFGTPGYGDRRADEIEAWIRSLPASRNDLGTSFDALLPSSFALRNYLWVHRPNDPAQARRLIDVLPPAVIASAMDYLVRDYWGRYLGWPDLIASRGDGDFFLAEVKSARDRLSEEQKRWISDNDAVLHLPFKLVKIRRRRSSARPDSLLR
jgi:hypothetical protein